MKTELTPTASAENCQCGSPLPDGRLYCSDLCRNRAKQQRHRDRARVPDADRREIDRVTQLVEEGSFLPAEPPECEHQPLSDHDGWHTCWRCGTVTRAVDIPDAAPFLEAA